MGAERASQTEPLSRYYFVLLDGYSFNYQEFSALATEKQRKEEKVRWSFSERGGTLYLVINSTNRYAKPTSNSPFLRNAHAHLPDDSTLLAA